MVDRERPKDAEVDIPQTVRLRRRAAFDKDAVRATFTARNAEVAPAPVFSRERIAAIRGRLELSQPVFAQALNVSADTVRAWEQGKRSPDGAALRLLQLADSHPQWVLEAVQLSDDAASTPPVTLGTRSKLGYSSNDS